MTALATMPDDELRRLGALSEGILLIESARLYGFVRGGPPVNIDRCHEVIDYARGERGLDWSDDEAQRAAAQFMNEANAEAERTRG